MIRRDDITIMAVVKRSRQRDAILTFLISRKDHPTAEVIYENVRKEFPNISLGTVYRNLSLLADTGHIIRVPCKDGSEHFDGNVKPHYHFQCTECYGISDLMNISPDIERSINRLAVDGFDGEVHGHQMFFFGICPKCKRKKEENIDRLSEM